MAGKAAADAYAVCEDAAMQKGNNTAPCTPDQKGSILPSAYGYCGASPTCATGKQNPDGTCVPPPCPAPKDVTYNKEQPTSDSSDPHVNPEMKFHLEEALKRIAADGGIKIKMKDGTEVIATPKIYEVYRSPERADYLHEKYLKGGPRAQAAGNTPHEYGIAVDIWLYDQNGKVIDNLSPIYGKKNAETNPNPTYPNAWYTISKKLASHMTAEMFLWGEPIGDTPHFEYHPNWEGLKGAKSLPGLRDTAKKEATQEGNPDGWLQKMWKNAGAACNPQ